MRVGCVKKGVKLVSICAYLGKRHFIQENMRLPTKKYVLGAKNLHVKNS